MNDYGKNILKDWENETNHLLVKGNYNELLLIISGELSKYFNNRSLIDNSDEQSIWKKLKNQLDCTSEKIRLNGKLSSEEKEHYLNWIRRVTNKYCLFISCFNRKTAKNSPDKIGDILELLELKPTIEGNAYTVVIKSYFERSKKLLIHTSLDDDNRILAEGAHLMIQLIENANVDNSKVQFSNYISAYRSFSDYQNIYRNEYLCFCIEKVNVSGLNKEYKKWIDKVKSTENAYLCDIEPPYFKERVIDVIKRKIEGALYPKYIEYSNSISDIDYVEIIKIKVRGLIGDGKIDKALKELEEIGDESMKNDVTILRNRCHTNEKIYNGGKIHDRIYIVENNKITNAIFDILEKLEESMLIQ